MTIFGADLSDSIKDYTFDLPPELIAQSPSENRENARLLLVRRNPQKGLPRFEDLLVTDLPRLYEEEAELKNSLWVRNRSKVIPARFYAKRPSGSRHEIVLLEEIAPKQWKALIRNSARFSYPQELYAEQDASLKLICREDGVIDFSDLGIDVIRFLENHGEMPLPPYIKTREVTRDKNRYQTVWADPTKSASVAAPTASLHFSEKLTQEMLDRGLRFADVVLHVGLGTFEPLRTDSVSQHQLHEERIEVSRTSLTQLEEALLCKHPITCIGTTAMRTLESLGLAGQAPSSRLRIEEFQADYLRGRSSHYIRPGVPIRYTSNLLTNFHLPESTLFVLVACFAQSRSLALEAYKHAISQKYRFFSYGDASLWI